MPAAPAEAALEETNSSLLSSQQAGASIAHQVTTAQPQPKGAQPNMLHNFQQQGGPANGQAATPGMPGAAQQAQHAQQAEHAQQVHQAQHSQHAWPAQQAHELPQPAQLAQQAVHAPKHAQQPQESQQAQHRADIDSGPANSVPLPQQATSPSSQASVKSAQPQHKSAVLAPSSVAASDAPVDLNSGQEEQPSTVDLSQSGHAQAANDVPTAANASLPLQQASSQDQIPASDSGRPTAAQPGTKQAGSAVSPVPSKHAVGQNDSLDAISAGRELSLNGSQASTDVHRTLRADQQAGAGSSSEPDLDRNGSQGTQNMGEDTQPLPKPSTQILDDMSFPISASEFEVEDMPSDDEHPDMAAGSGNESSAAAAHINSHAPSSQASDAHTANRTETPYTDQHDSTAGSSSPQATHAADTSHEAHASGATDKSASTVNSSGAQTDEDPAEPAWLQLEQLHLPCDEQGHPLTYFVGSEGSDADEEGQERQLCRLMFEVSHST